MNFPEAIQSGFRKYVTFSGRAARSELWFWKLFVFLGGFVLGIVEIALYGPHIGPLRIIFWIAVFLPGLSVDIRRLHDLDRSGWWFWITLIPLVGLIILLVWFCMKGTTGDNRFGPDPLAEPRIG